MKKEKYDNSLGKNIVPHCGCGGGGWRSTICNLTDLGIRLWECGLYPSRRLENKIEGPLGSLQILFWSWRICLRDWHKSFKWDEDDGGRK